MKFQKVKNESYICELIRLDSIESFISYRNKHNLQLEFAKIKISPPETNSFLFRSEPALIKYDTFSGSINIINYLLTNGANLTKSLCPYNLWWKYRVISNI